MLPAVDLLISQLIWSVYLPSDYSYLHFSSTLEIEEMIRGIGYLSRDTRTYDAEAMRQLAGLDPESDIPMDEDQIKELYDGKDYKSEFRNVPLEAPQVAGQLNAEMEFGGRMEALEKRSAVIGTGKAVGVLPIQIRIPTGGQVYRFARTIIRPDDVLSMSVTYGRNWVVSPSNGYWQDSCCC